MKTSYVSPAFFTRRFKGLMGAAMGLALGGDVAYATTQVAPQAAPLAMGMGALFIAVGSLLPLSFYSSFRETDLKLKREEALWDALCEQAPAAYGFDPLMLENGRTVRGEYQGHVISAEVLILRQDAEGIEFVITRQGDELPRRGGVLQVPPSPAPLLLTGPTPLQDALPASKASFPTT